MEEALGPQKASTTQRKDGFSVENTGDGDVTVTKPDSNTFTLKSKNKERFTKAGTYKFSKDDYNIANAKFSLDTGTFEVTEGTSNESADLVFSVKFS
jgi:uncharacterized protein YkuJ